MDRFVLDVRASLRGLRSSPGLVIIAVSALAMGIGFTTTMFSIVHGGTSNLPFERPDELVMVSQTYPQYGIRDMSVGAFTFRDWVSQQESFEGLAAFRSEGINISGAGDRPIRETATFITPNGFELLGAAPAVGRGFSADDARPGAEPVALLGHDLWRARFGEDPSVLGTTVRLNGLAHTIVGVMPPGFGFPVSSDVWMPLLPDASAAPAQDENLRVFGRLRTGVPASRANLEIGTITDRLASDYDAISGRGARVFPFVEFEMNPESARVLYLMLGAVSFVLLIACANVANLLLARAAGRTRDVAIRSALGASRRRIIAVHMVESVVLAVVGGAIGLVIAHVGVGFFDRSSAAIIEAFWVEFEVDPAVVFFATLLTGGAAVLAGVMPAIRASAADIGEALRDRSGGQSSLRIGRLSRGLVVAEVALACGLLIMTLVLTGSAVRLRAFDFPFETRDVFTAQLGLSASHSADRESLNALLTGVDREVRAIPGIRTAALMSALPGRGSGNWQISFGDDEATLYSRVVSVTPDYFELFGGRALRGRLIGAQDGPGTARVAVVNESFVSRFSPGREPVGRTIDIGQEAFQIVGVVPDLVVQDVEDRTADGIYIPLTQFYTGRVYVVARTTGAPLALTEPVFDAVATIDPDLPIMGPATLHDAIYADKRILDAIGALFFVFGVSAVALTVIGLYGVVSFAVNQRTREIGIRVALGADRRNVFGMILRQGTRQLLTGIAIGTPLAFVLSRALASGVEVVEPAGFLTLLLVGGSIAATSLIALVVPARRALRVQPLTALREG